MRCGAPDDVCVLRVCDAGRLRTVVHDGGGTRRGR